MNMKTSLSIIFILIAAVARVPAARQETAGVVEHFSKDGLSFDYPAGWALTDNSNEQLQSLVLSRKDNSTLIMVFAQRAPITTAEQLFESRRAVTAPYVENIARKIGLDKSPPPEDSQCVEAGGSSAVGFRLAGRINNEPTTAEVYTTLLGQRLIHLVHIRADKEEAQGTPVWRAVLETLKVMPPGAVKIATPGVDAEAEAAKMRGIVSGGVLNGKALKKPPPSYPAEAKFARAQGTVTVRIVVGESGDVISATAISGHRSLHRASEDAARRAKFSPTTLCGRPVKVGGLITYNFVLM